jgi:hypothetical protein
MIGEMAGTSETHGINSKLEIRNSKQIPIIKKQKILNEPVSDFDLSFEFPGLFRISSFGFRIFVNDA